MTEQELFTNLGRTSLIIRGQILNVFTVIEALMDDIIAKTTFDTEQEYHNFMDIVERKDLSMPIKKKLFKICLDKYVAKYGHDLTMTKDNIDLIVDKRNVVAHWMVDTSAEGVSLYQNSQTVRFMKTAKNKKEMVYELFEKEYAQKLELKILEVQRQLIMMQNTIDSSLASS